MLTSNQGVLDRCVTSLKTQVITKLAQGGPSLEIGCGDKKFTDTLSDAIGIDLNKEFEGTINTPGYFMDARNLDFPDESFNTVATLDTLGHIPESDLVIKEVWRVLKPNSVYLHPWSSDAIDRVSKRAGLVANELQYRRELILQRGTEWGLNRDGVVFKTDLWNEAIGHDNYVKKILSFNNICCCIDISKDVVSAAHIKHSNPSLTQLIYPFLVADLKHLPFRDGVFDSMYSPSTLDHMPPSEIHDSLQELRRTLKPSGRALITIDNVFCIWLYALVFRLFLSRISKRSWYPLSMWESVKLIRMSGLHIARQDSILLVPTVGGVLRMSQSPLKGLVNFLVRVSSVMESRSSILGPFKAENIFMVGRVDK